MTTVAVVGLGYVGLPLAIEFGKYFDTVGFDVSKAKVARLQQHNDVTGEVERGDFDLATKLKITDDPKEIGKADMVVVAVPTPIDSARLPDFTPLVSASKIVGANMKKGATVIYESTV
ncbi:MAG: nucleotide sugar dehydrogenase, partial [Lautropia sp.]